MKTKEYQASHMMNRMICKFNSILLIVCLAIISIYVPSSSASAQSTQKVKDLIKSGPMVGFGGIKEVSLWVQTRTPAKVVFKYWPIKEPQNIASSSVIHTNQANHLIARTTLSDLPSGTHFEYKVFVDGVYQNRGYPLRFQTQVRWQRKQSPPDFKLAIGSCAYFNLDEEDHYGGQYEIFEQIRAQKPDLMLWLGDNLYLGPEDWSSPEGIYRRYEAQRAHPSIQPLLASTHHYAIWDDHDYGPNDANRSYSLKNVSLAAFKDYWLNPNYGLPELPGIFGTFSWSDVDFFLLDDRTYRAPGNTPNSRDKPLLGEAQMQWLIDALAASRASFKIVAIGSQVLNPYTRFEGYSQHSVEKAQLLQSIVDYKIEGVLFLSGDRHFTELNKFNIDPWFYPLYDFTSSPLTSRPASSVEEERDNPLREKGTLVGDKRSFGLISVGGKDRERYIQLSAVNVGGQVIWSRTIKATELMIPKK